MTESTTTVVSDDRFSQGLTYGDYLAQIKVNQDRFAQYDGTAAEAVTDEDAAFFKEAVEKGCARVVVVGEDWCPDVYRGMPVIGRISEVSGMEMRVFPRDEKPGHCGCVPEQGRVPVHTYPGLLQRRPGIPVPLDRAAGAGHH